MDGLSFGEQVKIILSRKNMTIKELAELIEEKTGKAMSRQNLTQRLGRDNFQEQDMRMIAAILGCPFRLSIFPEDAQEDAHMMQYANLVGGPKRSRKQKAENETEEMYQQTLVFDEKLEPVIEPEPVGMQPKADLSDKDLMTKEDEMPAEEPEVPEDFAEAELSLRAEAAEDVEPDGIDGGADMAAPGREAADMEVPDVEVQSVGELPEEDERDMTIGELYDIHEELSELEEQKPKAETEKRGTDRFRTGGLFFRRKGKHGEDREREEAERLERIAKEQAEKKEEEERLAKQRAEEERREEERLVEEAKRAEALRRAEEERRMAANKKHARTAQSSAAEDFEPVIKHEDAEEDLSVGEVNPYTGREYQTNSVRMHPSRIGYVQVYDRSHHQWTDMTEWAFLGYQERKKALLGKDYEPPIYLD